VAPFHPPSPSSVCPPGDNAATFAEVKLGPVAAATKSGGIELRLPGRRCVVVRPGFDRQTLLDVLHLLETDASTGTGREAGI